MGLAGLTAVFGMGTGVAPPVWSPESRPAGGQAGPGVSSVGSVTREGTLATHINSYLGSLSDRSLAPHRFVACGQRADRGGQAARLLGPVG
jgi:hypothetical protein